MLNLFARISPSPAALLRVKDPIGEQNDAILNRWFNHWSRTSGVDLWCGWGTRMGRDGTGLSWFLEPFSVCCRTPTLRSRLAASSDALGRRPRGNRAIRFMPRQRLSSPFSLGRPGTDPSSCGDPDGCLSALMSRTPRRYAVNLHLVGGQTERVFFPKLETFQEWYQGWSMPRTRAVSSTVPLSDLEGEYLVVRPQAVIGVRVEPQFSSVDDA